MPLYEYRCRQCGQEFEKMLRFDQSEELPLCPICQSADTQKRISMFASKSSGGAFSVSTSDSSSCSSSRGGLT